MRNNSVKRSNSFEKGAFILVLTGLFAKALGALYRIPLTNIVGVEGIGMYQMIIPTLLLMLAISSNYMPVTISKCIAYLSSQKDDKIAVRIFNSAIKFVIIITLIISILLIIFSKKIALIQHNKMLNICYLLLIPTIIISGVKNVYRGWFFGYKDMLFPSIAQLLEQVVKIGVSLTLAYIGIKYYGVVQAVYGATIGLIAGEIASFFLLFIVRSIKKGPIKAGHYDKRLYYRLTIQESVPVMISGIVFPIVSFVDSFLIVNLLVRHGLSSSVAIEQYGLLQGPVYSLIHLPIMVATSLSLAIIPMLSSLYAQLDSICIKEKSSLSIKICLALVIPAAFGLCIIAKPILQILYPKISLDQLNFCATLMIASSINIVTLSLLEIFTSIMQGLSQSKFAAKTIVFSTLVKIAVELIFIKYIGILGAVISNIVLYLTAIIILSNKYAKLVGKDKCLVQSIGKIVFCSVIMALIIIACVSKINNNIIVVILSLTIGIIIYAILIILSNVFSDIELLSMPLGRKILEFRRGNHDKSNRAWK